jgi:hypothetical protein
LAEVTENTKRGVRGLILPASSELGNPSEDTLLPGTATELQRLGIAPREVALDGGFTTAATTSALEDLKPTNVFIAAARNQAPSARSVACAATGPAPRAGSATSSAATAWTDPA